MSKFITTKDGYVNLEHVASAIRVTGQTLSLLGANGKFMAEVTTGAFYNAVNRAGAFVPAGPNETAYVVTVLCSGLRPGEADVHVRKEFVRAWQVSSRGSVPVLDGGLRFDDTVLTIRPDGTVTDCFEFDYRTVGEACTAILERAERQWDAFTSAEQTQRERDEERADFATLLQ